MRNNEEYKPEPIDTTGVTLPESLEKLAELMAKNVHEVWAQNRIKEGWSFGETRDDRKRKHPCLVEYEKLPESEKDYDRATSIETLKLILSNGFKIIPPEQE
ncbi:MAG: Ryanodine receptor Ryr [Muribaculaceae bacterium]|nr:Ryanodine receptor Ryr [Muribaculaceae bacterium]